MKVMFILNPCAPFPPPRATLSSQHSLHLTCFAPISTVSIPKCNSSRPSTSLFAAKRSRAGEESAQNVQVEIEEDDGDGENSNSFDYVGNDDDFGGNRIRTEKNDFPLPGGFGGNGREEKDYDRDPEIAEILGNCLSDPDTARSKMSERLKKKRNKILHTKTGSAAPMKVIFNKFGFSNSYIWFEFNNTPLEKDISLFSDAIRAWHIIGRLGGCNSMNMQLSQSTFDKIPKYDAIQGANVNPATFYNIGDLEIQDNVARLWVDIGSSDSLLLDVLINALTQISSDYFGIKQVVFGGSEFEQWKENLTTEDAGYSVHKI